MPQDIQIEKWSLRIPHDLTSIIATRYAKQSYDRVMLNWLNDLIRMKGQRSSEYLESKRAA